MNCRHTRKMTLALAGAVVLLGGCAANRLHREGLAAVDAGNYEQGIAELREAVRKDPNNLAFRLDLRVREEGAVQRLIATADAARGAGRRDEAAAAYRRVLVLDPANDRALRGLEGVVADERHTTAMAAAERDVAGNELDRAETAVRGVLAEDPGFAPALALAQQIDQKRGPVKVTPKLKTKDNRPVTLQFRDANTKMVFEVLSRQTGINFIFDKDIKGDGKTTIFVQDVPIEAAIDLVLGQNQLARQVLAPNMVLLYPNNASKQKDYEDEIVKTFYLSDADPKQAQALIKAIVNPKAMFIDEKSSVLVVRDTPDVVRMIEKLVTSIDLPDAEVMLEVEVLEIAHSKVEQLGIQYPSAVSFTANAPSGAGGLVLADLARQGKHTISVSGLSVQLNALKTTGVTNTLASPRIRARNHEKAKILIGQRVPVITNSVTPTASSSVVTGSVQYLDVGLTLDVEPTVHRDGDVAIKLGLEVSTILNQVTTASGTIAYTIGTRNATTLLQLRDGETQILAGLIQDSDSKSANTIPGLGDMPLLGRLFGVHKSDREKTEIVLAVTPRIIRAQRRPSSETTEFWYGTESGTRSAPIGGFTFEGMPGGAGAGRPQPGGGAVPMPSTALQSAMAPTAPAQSAAQAPTPAQAPESSVAVDAGAAPVVRESVAPTATVPAGSAPPAGWAGSTPPPAAGGAAPDAGAAGAPPTLLWQAPTEVRLGEEFDVTLKLAGGQPLTQLRSQVRFDPAALELLAATAGDVASRTDAHVETPRGMVAIDANATAESPLPGSGDVLVMRFKALAVRASTPLSGRLAAATARGGAGMPSAPALNLAIKP